VSENKVLRITFIPKREEVTAQWRKPYNQVPHRFFFTIVTKSNHGRGRKTQSFSSWRNLKGENHMGDLGIFLVCYLTALSVSRLHSVNE
jgi:hypothetical protein